MFQSVMLVIAAVAIIAVAVFAMNSGSDLNIGGDSQASAAASAVLLQAGELKTDILAVADRRGVPAATLTADDDADTGIYSSTTATFERVMVPLKPLAMALSGTLPNSATTLQPKGAWVLTHDTMSGTNGPVGIGLIPETFISVGPLKQTVCAQINKTERGSTTIPDATAALTAVSASDAKWLPITDGMPSVCVKVADTYTYFAIVRIDSEA